jgi:uncharacterized protein YcbX
MNSSTKLTVCQLFRYPIKACGPEHVDALQFDTEGLLIGDREWVVVDQDSTVVWQGSHPRLALIRPVLQNGALTMLNDAGDQLIVEAMNGSDSDEVRIWNDFSKCLDIHRGKDAGDKAARFLQQTAGPGLRLVRLGREALQRNGLNPVHLATVDSVNEFLAALAPEQRHLVNALRFRPNILVQGHGESLLPFVEDHLSRLNWSSNGAECGLFVTSLCIRCIVPNVDPSTGLMDNSILEAVSKLSAERFPAQPTYFGVYVRPTGPGVLLRGDAMTGTFSF